MRTLAVLTPDPPLAETAARLDKRTAVIDASSTADNTPVEAGRFDLRADGTWHGCTSGDTLRQLLDRLAPDYEYALLGNRSGRRLPTVVAGDEPTVVAGDDEPTGRVVQRLDDEPTPERLAAIVRSVEPYVTLETMVEACKQAAGEERAGAIATFTGRVRAKDGPDDVRTTHLDFERYDEVAAERLAQLETSLLDRDGVFDVRTHHRTGLIEAGEDIVFVVVLAGHREQAFRTVSDGIDRLKAEVPIFKKEITTENAAWKHERP